MERMEDSLWGILYLPGYVSLQPADKGADAYLALLEKEGYLPPTVCWLSDEGLKMRLFLAPGGIYPLDIKCNGMAIEVHTGACDCVHIKSPQVRRKLHQVCGDASFLINEPTKLPIVTFEFLRLLTLMGSVPSTLKPEVD